MKLFCTVCTLATLMLILVQPEVGTAENLAPHDTDSVICAAVLPCDKDGSVLPPYNLGPCAAIYQRQCFSQKANQLASMVESCTSDSLKKEAKYRRTIRSLKKQLKSRKH